MGELEEVLEMSPFTISFSSMIYCSRHGLLGGMEEVCGDEGDRGDGGGGGDVGGVGRCRRCGEMEEMQLVEEMSSSTISFFKLIYSNTF